jgi:hypothetical protein
MPAGWVNTSDAVVLGRPHAHLYAWTHTASSSVGTPAAKERESEKEREGEWDTETESLHGRILCGESALDSHLWYVPFYR